MVDDQTSESQSKINSILRIMLGRDTDIKEILPRATSFLQLAITFYPTKGHSIFDGFISNAEFLIFFLSFKVNKAKSDKDFFWRLFGVCFALASKIDCNE